MTFSLKQTESLESDSIFNNSEIGPNKVKKSQYEIKQIQQNIVSKLKTL